ncbi:MAG: GWxTD domain-containing protein [Candidatus Hydrothermales bacterium]
MIKILVHFLISTVFLSKGKFEFYLFPFTTFNGHNFSIEMWYELNVNQVPLEKKVGYYEGKFDIEVYWENILKGETRKDKFTKSFKIGGYTDKTKIYDVFILNLDEGEYLIKVKFKTKAKEGEVNFKKSLKINYPFISDIFIVPRIGKKEEYFFTREHFSFDPKFPLNFSFPDSIIHFFYELYGFEGREIVSYEVYRDGEKIYSKENKVPSTKRGITSASISLNKLDTGDYTLVVSVIKDGNVHFKREERFSYVSFKTIKEESIKRYYENYLFFIDYFATPEEIEEFRKISDFNGKKLFVQKFWKKFDPDPETEANEFVIELIKRIKFSDQNFSLGLKLKGRYTDRGKIFIKYGEPSYVTSSYYPEANRAWESWVYTSPKRIQFIFVDINQDGNYLLTYSSLPEEPPSVANWEKWIPGEIIEVKK